MKKLLAIGEALIDFIPAQRDCLLKEVEQFTRVCGGAPANVAAAAAKLGGDSSLISQLGRDAFGDYIVDTLADAGVDTSKICRTDRANTALAFVSLKADGNRDFSFYRKPSADMLLDLGVEYVIVGHSERRQYFAETDQTVNKRALAALNAGLKVILCVGESLEQREEGVTEELVRMQTKIALLGVTAEQMANVVIAYEPVWAIGTGKTATADQAEEVCAQIRKVVGELYGEAVAEATTVQYGGSMNAKNCEELLSKKDVDGGLIGGASLKAPDFAVIVNAATKG